MYRSIFLDIYLPNAATWFYFSLILTLAVFFKFNRVLSLRNWDLLTLFALVPGLLLLEQARDMTADAGPFERTAAALYVTPDLTGMASIPAGITGAVARTQLAAASWHRWAGYLILISGSAYFFVRCLVDLALTRRPEWPPNLHPANMSWLALALLISLSYVAVRTPPATDVSARAPNAVVEQAQRVATDFVQQNAPSYEGERVKFWVERSFAGAGHLALVAALIVIGCRIFGDYAAGVGCALAYLLLPYTAIQIKELQHVIPAALVLWAVVFYTHPKVAGTLIGLAAGGFAFPGFLIPAWISFFWGRGARGFLKGAAWGALFSLVLTAFVLWLNGRLGPNFQLPIGLPDWHFWKAHEFEGFWNGVHWAYRIPVFIAFVFFVILTAFWPAPKDLAHLLALSAAVLIGVNLWYADQGGTYVLWYLPTLLLVVFRPNLSDVRPPTLGEKPTVAPGEQTSSRSRLRGADSPQSRT